MRGLWLMWIGFEPPTKLASSYVLGDGDAIGVTRCNPELTHNQRGVKSTGLNWMVSHPGESVTPCNIS